MHTCLLTSIILQSLIGAMPSGMPSSDARDMAAIQARIAEHESDVRQIEIRQTSISAEQATIYAELAQLYVQIGQDDAANSAAQKYVDAYQILYPGDIDKQLPAMMLQARTLAETQLSIDAGQMYRRILADLKKAKGGYSLAQLPVALELAEHYRSHDITDGVSGNAAAERLLRRTLHTAKRDPDTTAEQMGMIYLAFADHYIATGTNPVKGRKYYARAWAALNEANNASALREQWFSGTVPLYATQGIPPLVEVLLEPTTNPRDTTLVAEFSVDTGGRASDIVIADNNESKHVNSALEQYVKAIRFRPSMVDGQAAAMQGHRFELTFARKQIPDRYRYD